LNMLCNASAFAYDRDWKNQCSSHTDVAQLCAHTALGYGVSRPNRIYRITQWWPQSVS
jgi:hypothetical protein